jgi:hypothetical protein
VGKEKKKQLTKSPWLAWELQPNREMFPNQLPFILHGALVGAGSLWPWLFSQISRCLTLTGPFCWPGRQGYCV